jgi:cyclopropane-fatty-acyl-phospholipid synthase
MADDRFLRKIESLFGQAGITLNGDQPWDIQVHDARLYRRILAQGSLGLGEAYMDGWWECSRLDSLFHRMLAARLDDAILTFDMILDGLKARLSNLQSVPRAFQVGEHHYDIGNDLYQLMLDARMIYSCAYWQGAEDLDGAQERKLDLICRKLHLTPGQRLLDIGCGWGGMARFAAERYGVEVVGVTISSEQLLLAREVCRGLPVEIRLQDYRSLHEPFDRIVSIGMFEHVGYRNYRTFMTVADRCLKSDGLFLLHTIACNVSKTVIDPWLGRYIFPNGMLPSAVQISKASEGIFMIEDWHNFGPDYDRTLMAWWRNFEDAWPQLAPRYGERFYRMWRYYLLCCAAAFRARTNQLWQIVFSKKGAPEGYQAAR